MRTSTAQPYGGVQDSVRRGGEVMAQLPRPRQVPGARSAAAEYFGPLPELVLKDQVVAAGHGLQQPGAHGRFGGEAGRAAQDGQGGADAGGDVLPEQ
ncbi:hypothetical protein [Streptomyces europaeiscabiei]|uniref:hypothetical protein n=1 Tax=Streptomyces europaeiscabiei TaxID=146819 RepID=UPI0029AAEEEE|nr:hypothetical protein [Streptomyces europaeiscabiei]MDX3845801.1 hypothetical protein [Streptomyces europaeiscabiei]